MVVKEPLFLSRSSLMPERKFPCTGVEIPLWRVKISLVMAQNSPRGGQNPPFSVKKILSVWFGVTAVCALVHVPRHDFLLFAGTRKVLTFAPAFRKGGGSRAAARGGRKKRGRGKKSLAVSSETLTFAARFPLEWGEPRGMAAASGGGVQRRAFFEGIGSKRQAAPRGLSGPGGASRGFVPRAGKNRKSQFLQRRV